jgi:hypothetical protein
MVVGKAGCSLFVDNVPITRISIHEAELRGTACGAQCCLACCNKGLQNFFVAMPLPQPILLLMMLEPPR